MRVFDAEDVASLCAGQISDRLHRPEVSISQTPLFLPDLHDRFEGSVDCIGYPLLKRRVNPVTLPRNNIELRLDYQIARGGLDDLQGHRGPTVFDLRDRSLTGSSLTCPDLKTSPQPTTSSLVTAMSGASTLQKITASRPVSLAVLTNARASSRESSGK